MLVQAVSIASSLQYKLKIFDAYRPQYVQESLWSGYPNPNFLSDPKKGSPHTKGIAVDLTLTDKNNNELDALGIEDILEQGCLLVEWPEKIKELYENNTLEIKFKDINGRKSIELKNIKGWETRIKILESNKNG